MATSGGEVACRRIREDPPTTRDAQDDDMETPYGDDQLTTSDLPLVIDGHEVTALVDTGADYSVLSGNLAARLKKVMTVWEGPQIRTAGGHLITPVGRCTARIQIRGITFIASFVVLKECSRKVILGMYFLGENGAIIDLRRQMITFSTARCVEEENSTLRRSPLRVTDDHVCLPPCSSMLVTLRTDETASSGIAEANSSLLLERGICIARGLVHLHDGQTELLLTNFRSEHQHISRETTIAYLEDVADVSGSFSLEASLPGKITTTSTRTFDVNRELPEKEKEHLLDLLHRYNDCFPSSSKVRRTTVAKHRIITDEATTPKRQPPYRVSHKDDTETGRRNAP